MNGRMERAVLALAVANLLFLGFEILYHLVTLVRP